MNREGRRPPTVVWVTTLLCLVLAVGVVLENRFTFTGARWEPDAGGQPPKVVKTPAPHRSPAPTATPHPSQHGQFTIDWLPLMIVLAVAVIAVVAYLVWRWLHRRRRAGAALEFSTVAAETVDVAPETEPDIPTLRRGLALASSALETEREPRDAIVRAWIGLQEAAEDSGMTRRASETPTEFTSRVFSTVHADRAAAEALLAVYLRVRFGSQSATADDLARARAAVLALSESWPAEAMPR